jgi:methylthioribose-1-phosphate isomerase
MRTIEWDARSSELRLIDQRMLPEELKIASLSEPRQAAEAIRDMMVRGAPAIGITGAFGLALAAIHSKARTTKELRIDLEEAASLLREARPTAVNLGWALDQVMDEIDWEESSCDKLRIAVLSSAQKLADEDVATNRRMAENGAVLIDDGDTILHHCNTGALAAVDWGTALGVIRTAHEQGKRIHVLVDETRPRLQGSRLTAWELQQYHIPYHIISDNAAGFFLQSGKVNKVLFGGDRVAANGDVVNKIGTYMLALAAHDNAVPVYAVVPTSSIDLSLASGELVPIEERDPNEVLSLKVEGRATAPREATALNPAFDITPYRLLTAIVTENGIVYPPFLENLGKAVNGNLK